MAFLLPFPFAGTGYCFGFGSVRIGVTSVKLNGQGLQVGKEGMLFQRLRVTDSDISVDKTVSSGVFLTVCESRIPCAREQAWKVLHIPPSV